MSNNILYVLSFFGLLSFIFLILYLLKKNVNYYVIAGMYRTVKGLDIIDKLSKTKISKILEILSIYIGTPIIVVALILLIYGFFDSKARFTPLIPGISIGGTQIPVFPVILAIFIAALVHEIAHGILVRYYGLKLKSWGFFFLGPFLGAFVEPDEKEIEEIDPKRQIAIYNAGVTTNIITALVFLLLSNVLIAPALNDTVTFTNVTIIGIENNTPAYYSGIPINSTILYIDGVKISTLNDISNILKNKNSGENITLVTDNGNYTITLTSKEGRPYMGVYLKQNYIINDERLYEILSTLSYFIQWIIIVNVGIAIANMLPIYGLDGGRTFYALLRYRFNKEKAKMLSVRIGYIVLALLLINVSLNFV